MSRTIPTPLKRFRHSHPADLRVLDLATFSAGQDGPDANVPVEGHLAGLLMLAANPVLTAKDRTQQLLKFDRLVREGEPLDKGLLQELGELMGKGSGRILVRSVKLSRNKGLAESRRAC